MSRTKAQGYISIYVYMIMVSGKKEMGIGKGRIGDRLKGTFRPSDKNPIGEYICRIDRIETFSTGIFYGDFLLPFST